MLRFKSLSIKGFLLSAFAVPFLIGCEQTGDSEAKVAMPKQETSSKLLPTGIASLPDKGEVFALMVEDISGDGLSDVVVIDHSGGEGRAYVQTEKRVFSPAKLIDGIGFHPGNMISWAPSKGEFVLAAEGENAIVHFVAEAETFLKPKNRVSVRAPRFITAFDWPDWGRCLAIVPYVNGFISVMKGADLSSTEGQSALIVFPLSKGKNTIRESERVRPVDVDGDGVVELLTVMAITNEVISFKYPGKNAKLGTTLSVLHKANNWGMPNDLIGVDIDSDSDQDLLIPDEAPPGRLHVLINNGRGKFKPSQDLRLSGEKGIMELRFFEDKEGSRMLLAAEYGFLTLVRIPSKFSANTPLEMKRVEWKEDLSFDLEVADLDGDGWKDLILGRTLGEDHVWIAYGPLWDRFAELEKNNFVLQ